MFWSVLFRDVWGNLIKRVFIEFNIENKVEKVSMENKLF